MDTDTRIECTNWDDEVSVATWAKGRARKPARKVLTRGVAKVRLTRGQMSHITKMLGSGMRLRSMTGGKTLHGEGKTLHDRRRNAP